MAAWVIEFEKVRVEHEHEARKPREEMGPGAQRLSSPSRRVRDEERASEGEDCSLPLWCGHGSSAALFVERGLEGTAYL